MIVVPTTLVILQLIQRVTEYKLQKWKSN